MSEETVTITKKEYDQLVKDSAWLSCLQEAGVDNWSGYEMAQDIKRDIENGRDASW